MNHADQTAAVEAVARAVLGPISAEANRRKGPTAPDAAEAAAAESVDVVNADELPMAGAEDFSYFLMPEKGGKPGCFFFLGGHEEALSGLSSVAPALGGDAASPGAFATKAANEARQAAKRSNCICHGTSFDFNDNLIPSAAALWVRLVEARLGAVLFGADELSPKTLLDAAETAAANLAAIPSVSHKAP
jgi:metal-dependent amidase/aminoacylase/carboxypeptidase family protein